MTDFKDSTKHPKRDQLINRRRFMQRFKQEIKNAVTDAISKKKLSEQTQDQNVSLPEDAIKEPQFEYETQDPGLVVLPGNTHYVEGDKIERPPAASMSTQQTCSRTGFGEDAFIFKLDQNEFLDLFFENLELPHMRSKTAYNIHKSKLKPAGTSKSGQPHRIHVLETMKQALIRKRIAQKRDQPETHRPPFLQDRDVRYRLDTPQILPHTQAVMFCLMDVSGSMDEKKKDLAKRFFVLLYLFLKRHYETIELVFIRHHTIAKEVNEDDFFYSRETGGTVASTALELMKSTLDARYPPDAWNVYAVQASDGDNWNADSPYCEQILLNQILPLVQYYTYIEIMPRHHQSLWQAYQRVVQKSDHFAMRQINQAHEIYPVFKALFKKS